jgi:hypothetical protein
MLSWVVISPSVSIAQTPPTSNPSEEDIKKADDAASKTSLKLTGEFNLDLPSLTGDPCATKQGRLQLVQFGFLCPTLLPKRPLVPKSLELTLQTVCANGCYLSHPTDMKAYHIAKLKVLLIPDLLGERSLFQSQRDLALKDVVSLKTIREAQFKEIARLQDENRSLFTTWDMVLGVGAGIGVGALVFGILYALK